MHTGIGWRQPHYAALLEQRPAVGFLQVHSENFFARGGAALATLAQARQDYPISLHGVGLSLGSAIGIDDWHLDQLAALAERIEPVRVSDHASFARVRGQQGKVQHGADLLPIPFTEAQLQVLCANVQQVQERLQRPLLIENLSAYLHFEEADFTEPQFLTELVRRTGCGLLLDVNNLYVNALNDQITGTAGDPLTHALRWLEQLPTTAVGEMHVAGHCVMTDIVIDDHGAPVCDAVWALYSAASARFGQPPALVEWDTHIPEFDVLMAQARHAEGLR